MDQRADVPDLPSADAVVNEVPCQDQPLGESHDGSPDDGTDEKPEDVHAAGKAAAETKESEDADETADAVPAAEVDEPNAPEPPRNSPAERFKELTEIVRQVDRRTAGLDDYMHLCKDKLFREADEYRMEGLQQGLSALIRLHDFTFRHVTAMESGERPLDGFAVSLLEFVEAELHSLGVEVFRPQPGDEVNLAVMTTIGTARCPFWRKERRVARVNACAFSLNHESKQRVLRKAEVTVYRR